VTIENADQVGGGTGIGARPPHYGGFAVSAGRAAACELPVQACLGVEALTTVVEGAAQCRTLRTGSKNSAWLSAPSALPRIRPMSRCSGISPIKTSRAWECARPSTKDVGGDCGACRCRPGTAAACVDRVEASRHCRAPASHGDVLRSGSKQPMNIESSVTPVRCSVLRI
jgi:hypothetical protein